MKRLFEIIYILLEKENITAKELAEHFEVSQRTIYRDIENLSEAGIPIYMTKGRGGGIRLLPNFILNKTVLSQEEKKEALAVLQGFTAINEISLNDKLSKLSTFLGGDSESWIEIDFSNWNRDDNLAEKFETLRNTIVDKKIVQFTYYSGKSNYLNRIVEPLKLVFKGQGWYLYGYCRSREDFRFFKLTRIDNINILSENFDRKIPNKVLVENIYENKNIVKIKVKLDKKMAFRVYDEFQDYELDEEGNYIIEIDFPAEEWLYGYIMSFGDNIEVLEPKEVREEVKRRLINTLNNY